MAASLSITPASGSITATVSATRIEVAGASPNMDDGTENRYRIQVRDGDSNVVGASHEFNVNGGKHVWNNYIFPSADTYELALVDLSDDSDAATLSVTVS
jgi:hypothetical protein